MTEMKTIAPVTLHMLVVLAPIVLAGCAGANPAAEDGASASAAVAATAPTSPPPAASAATPAPPPPAAPRTAQGRNNFPPPPAPPAPPPVAPGLTVEQARAECWMRYDRDKKVARDLDARLKLVETCVNAKMAAQSAAANPASNTAR